LKKWSLLAFGCVAGLLQVSAWATVFELPADGSAVFGSDQRIKATYTDTLLDIALVEAHPPVDAEGQTVEPNLALLSKQLDTALGKSTAAIHLDFAREALQAATGMPTVVGLEADMDPASAAAAVGAGPKAVAP
jgi:hypothetical protein